MKFYELTDAITDKKVLINFEKVFRVSDHFVFKKGKKIPAILVEFVRQDDFVTVKETYETIKDIIERAQ